MLFNCHKPLTNLDGEAVKEGDKVVSLGALAVSALELPPRENESGDAKFTRFLLQLRVKKHADSGEPVEITTDEAVAIKRAVAAVPHYPTSFYGRIVEEIEK